MPQPALDEPRLRRLIDAGRGVLAAKFDVDAVLQQLLDVAREVTGARYAAVGVLDETRQELERFITAGVDEATHRRIGDLPRGRGILGLLIEEPRPLRLEHLGRPPALVRVPGRAPPDGDVPGRPGDDPRRGLGQPLPDREDGRRRVHRRRRGVDRDPRRLGRDRDRQRAALRGGRAAPRPPRARRPQPRHDGRDRPGARRGDGPRPHPRADRQAGAGARRARGRW